MAVIVKHQTVESYGTYMWCHGCGQAFEEGTSIEASAPTVQNPQVPVKIETRWFRLCPSCLGDLLEAVVPQAASGAPQSASVVLVDGELLFELDLGLGFSAQLEPSNAREMIGHLQEYLKEVEKRGTDS